MFFVFKRNKLHLNAIIIAFNRKNECLRKNAIYCGYSQKILQLNAKIIAITPKVHCNLMQYCFSSSNCPRYSVAFKINLIFINYLVKNMRLK